MRLWERSEYIYASRQFLAGYGLLWPQLLLIGVWEADRSIARNEKAREPS
jgi:hypothetical protein